MMISGVLTFEEAAGEALVEILTKNHGHNNPDKFPARTLQRVFNQEHRVAIFFIAERAPSGNTAVLRCELYAWRLNDKKGKHTKLKSYPLPKLSDADGNNFLEALEVLSQRRLLPELVEVEAGQIRVRHNAQEEVITY